MFDGSDYNRAVDRHSEVYGNTTVGYGTMVMNGSVIYGASNTVGSFTLNEWATLSTDDTTNRIQANQITMKGTVDVATGGTLELAVANGVNFNGTLYTGLDMNTSGYLDVLGNLTFGKDGFTLQLGWCEHFFHGVQGRMWWVRENKLTEVYACFSTCFPLVRPEAPCF